MTFAVTYDGLTQTLDPATGEREAGAAAGALRRAESRTSRRRVRPTVSTERACSSTSPAWQGLPQRTPYLPGPGWAADGRSWLVVGISVSVDSVVVDGTSYDVESLEPR